MAAADTVDTVTDDCGRLAGQTRYGTAGAIGDAYEAQSPTDTAIIASGLNFPDALAASGLARELDAPVLLTDPNSVPLETSSALEDLGIANVVIVGGTEAVGQSVEDSLAADYAVERVAGDDRYQTAHDIAVDEIVEAGQHNGLTTAIIATGLNYPDALAGGPVAYHGDGTNPFPILLTAGDTVPAATSDALDALGIEQVIILGGTAVVPATVEAQLVAQTGNPAIRLAGTNREGTAQDVADFAVDELGFAPEAVLLADGYLRFPSPDALTGGPLGGVEMAPILLVNNPNGAAMPAATETFITENEAAIQQVIALGGTAAVDTAVLNAGCEAGGVPVPSESGPVAALALTPETAVNPVDADHTVMATLTDAEGDPAADGDAVRFEVYSDVDGAADSCDALLGASSSDCYTFIEGGVVDAADGQASFTYTSSDVRNDFIVACVVTAEVGEGENDPCTVDNPNTAFFNEEGTLEVDRGTGEARNVDDDRITDVAEKEWQVRVAAALELTPETAVNTFNQPHTVTATVTDQFGDPLEGETVTFEVYRDVEDNPDAGYVLAEAGTETTDAEGADTADTADDEAAGEATYTYTYGGPAEANDLIVACLDADADGCAELSDDDPTVIDPIVVVVDADDEFNDTATKQWVEPVATTLELSPETDVNPADADHTVVANVLDQQDKPLSGETITFEVFRQDPATGDFTQVGAAATDTSDAGGDADFTYTGPGVDASDTIVACVTTDVADDCATISPSGDVVIFEGQLSDTATKQWVETDPATAGQYTGEVFGQGPADPADSQLVQGELDVFTGQDALRFLTESTDTFIVNGETVDRGTFQEAVRQTLESDATNEIAIEYDPTPFTVSTFNLTTGLDYFVTATAYEFTDISGTGTQLATVSGCDDCAEEVAMPFNTTFYGVTTNLLAVSSNGYVCVGATPGECSEYFNVDLPTTDVGRALLAFWDDLDPGDLGDIYVQTVGTAGSRQFIVQYEGVEHYSCAGAATFQIVITEGSNDFQYNYEDTLFGNAACDNGASATVGTNAGDGVRATEYSYNEPVILSGTSLLVEHL